MNGILGYQQPGSVNSGSLGVAQAGAFRSGSLGVAQAEAFRSGSLGVAQPGAFQSGSLGKGPWAGLRAPRRHVGMPVRGMGFHEAEAYRSGSLGVAQAGAYRSGTLGRWQMPRGRHHALAPMRGLGCGCGGKATSGLGTTMKPLYQTVKGLGALGRALSGMSIGLDFIVGAAIAGGGVYYVLKANGGC